jgi:hypothetical protein
MGRPTYDKVMRERAKAEKRFLVTVDFVRPSGEHDMCAQNLFNDAERQIVYDGWFKAFKMMQDRKAAEVK